MTTRTRFQHGMIRTALALAVLTVAGVIVQIFLAGLALFDSAGRWADHKTFGMMIGPVIILLVLAVLLSRPSRGLASMSITLLVLYIVQINLPDASPGWIAALHPLVGFTILGLPIGLTPHLWRILRIPATKSAQDPSMDSRRPSSATAEQ